MAKCHPFKIAFSGNAEILVTQARKFAEDNGGSFSGDRESGSFEAMIMGISRFSGDYRIEKQQMTIVIKEKPIILSCSAIEKAIRQRLDRLSL